MSSRFPLPFLFTLLLTSPAILCLLSLTRKCCCCYCYRLRLTNLNRVVDRIQRVWGWSPEQMLRRSRCNACWTLAHATLHCTRPPRGGHRRLLIPRRRCQPSSVVSGPTLESEPNGIERNRTEPELLPLIVFVDATRQNELEESGKRSRGSI